MPMMARIIWNDSLPHARRARARLSLERRRLPGGAWQAALRDPSHRAGQVLEPSGPRGSCRMGDVARHPDPYSRSIETSGHHRIIPLDTEPARIRGFYEVRARRGEPTGLACLWPDRGVTGVIGSHRQFRVILGALVRLLATGDR